MKFLIMANVSDHQYIHEREPQPPPSLSAHLYASPSLSLSPCHLSLSLCAPLFRSGPYFSLFLSHCPLTLSLHLSLSFAPSLFLYHWCSLSLPLSQSAPSFSLFVPSFSLSLYLSPSLSLSLSRCPLSAPSLFISAPLSLSPLSLCPLSHFYCALLSRCPLYFSLSAASLSAPLSLSLCPLSVSLSLCPPFLSLSLPPLSLCFSLSLPLSLFLSGHTWDKYLSDSMHLGPCDLLGWYSWPLCNYKWSRTSRRAVRL